MKKLFLLVLLTATTVLLFANNGHRIKDEKEYVEIEKEKEGIEEGRSLSYVECYIDREYGILEISYAGIGVPSVSIVDAFDNADINYQTNAFSNRIIIQLPTESGLYTIHIETNNYKGRGVFEVY